MAPAAMARPVLRRPHSLAGKLFIASVAVGAAALAALERLSSEAEPMAFALAGGGLVGLGPRAPGSAADSLTSLGAIVKVKRPWKGSSKYQTYDGYVFRKKRLPWLRIRLDRWGTGKTPFYRIKATFQPKKQNKAGRYLEHLGWWDPLRDMDDPRAMKMKADRCVFWLRKGAQPTDQVASLLDRIGIIRRTGPTSTHGEWEWRIPKTSGPSAPEGWSFDGPQEVTWDNKPMIKHRKGHPHAKSRRYLPLIEKFGFQGYSKIPIEGDVITEPVTRSTLLEAFPNTELPSL
mmetsp:Transcript_17447/g.55228  ORF Transcript_17447/g.55228 Transcript_17447/m.55228 type:complete len:289 (+) Transcript_17447:77-943(+)